MNVYITYRKDGYGGQEVDQVFLSEEAAIDYVINEKFAGLELMMINILGLEYNTRIYRACKV